MSPSVISHKAALPSGTSGALALDTAPTAGDVLVYVYAGSGTTPNPPAAITSTTGATWTEAQRSTRTVVWVGVGATTTGTVSTTLFSGSGASMVALFHLRGVSERAAAGWATANPGTAEAPAVTAYPSQVVLACAFSADSIAAPGSLPDPALWSVNPSGSAGRYAFRVPTEAATHAIRATRSSGRVVLLQAVVGAPPPPDPPTGLVQTAATPTSVDVAWSPPTAGTAATGYEYRVDGGDPVSVGLVTTATIAGLAPASTYDVQVRAVNGDGPSAWTSPLAAVTDPVRVADWRWWTHRLAAAVGLDPLEDQPVVQVRVWDGAGFVVDDTLSRALQSYQVTYGRKDPTARVEPVTASLVWATPRLAGAPAVATRLQVALSPVVCAAIGLDPVDGIRFTGEVTDPAVAHARRLTSAAMAGRLGRANRMPVDGTGWPIEDDADRVARILPAAGVGLVAGTIDPGTVPVAPPTRLETVATLLEQTAASSLGQVVEQPSGVIDWHDAEHRRDPVVAVTLDSADVFRDVTWTQRLASLVNDLDVKTAAGTVVTVTDLESAAPDRYGPWPGTIDTILTSTANAANLGVDIVGRRADPSWQLPDLTVDLIRTVDLEDLAGVLALRHGALLEILNLPAAFPNDGRVFVEGYVETATPRSWTLALSVSDRLQSGVGIRWIDWPDTDDYQWQDLDPDLTWFDLARIYDPADTL